MATRGNHMSIPGYGDKWLQKFVPYLVYRITNQLTRRMRGRLRKAGINIARWRVLAVLRAQGNLSLGKIVELTVMEQPSVSRVVSQLEREGMVKREVSKKDSRCIHVTLTRAGDKAFQDVYPMVRRHQELALNGFTRQERSVLVGYLRRIQENIEFEE